MKHSTLGGSSKYVVYGQLLHGHRSYSDRYMYHNVGMYDEPEGILDRSATPKHDCNLINIISVLRPPSGIHNVTEGLAPVRQGNMSSRARDLAVLGSR